MRSISLSLRSAFALAVACVASTAACSSAPDGEAPSVSAEQNIICQTKGQGCGSSSGGSSSSSSSSSGGSYCGGLGQTCCPATWSNPNGSCGDSYTCMNGTCGICGEEGQAACPDGSCMSGIAIQGTCWACSDFTDSNVAAQATSPTQATVTFTPSHPVQTDAWLVNAADMSDQHQAWSTPPSNSSVAVAGLRPGSTYEIVLLPDGATCGTPPTTVKQAGNGFNSGTAALARSAVDFNLSTVAFSNGSLVFAPSPKLLAAMPSLGTPAVPLPTKTFSPGGIYPDYTASFTSFAIPGGLSNVTLQFNNTDLEFIVPFTATMHLHTGNVLFPDADLNIDSGSFVDIKFAWSASANGFVIEPVTSNIASHVSNCGIFSFCNSAFQSQLPDLDATFSQAIQGVIGSKLSDPSVTVAFDAILAQADNKLRTSATPWSVVPGSVGYSAGAFIYTVQRVGNAVGQVTTPAH